jgi:hypothetical protein
MRLYFLIIHLISRYAINGQSIQTDASGKKYIKPLFLKAGLKVHLTCFDESNGYTVVGGAVQDEGGPT